MHGKTDSFFGYKVEFAMVPEERIITAVTVQDGAYVDGTEYEALFRQTKECGIQISDAYGDKAYFRQPIIDLLECEKGTRIAKMLEISVNTPKFYDYSQREKTEEFKVKYRKRVCHEGKNGELSGSMEWTEHEATV